jgi:integrase
VEALIPEGGKRPTSDQAQAALIFARRLQYWDDVRAGRVEEKEPMGPVPLLTQYMPRHVELKAGTVRPYTLERERRRIVSHVLAFRGDVRLDAIDSRWVNDLVLWLKRRPGRRFGSRLSAQSIHHVLNALSSVLSSAVSDGHIAVNSVAFARRPRIDRGETRYLESHEGWALLEAAERIEASTDYRATPSLAALLATFLLTGGRRQEVFTLLVSDVDFDNGLVQFRPNEYYGARKSRTAVRTVPLWHQLRQYLVPVIGDRQRGLLFRSRSGRQIRDARGILDRILREAGIEKPEGQEWHLFRHTYTALRLQTTDHGAPISLWSVARELGHKSVSQIEGTYGHLLNVRHRVDQVEYRPQDGKRARWLTA